MKTRKPTGLPSWPLMLLAGGEGSGKSYLSAQASASPLIGATYWFGHGEQKPDEYGAIEDADFDIVELDGTIRDLKQNIREALVQPKVDGKPNLLVVDSGTKVWGTISENAQLDADRRAGRGKEGAQITVDLWNKHKADWRQIIDILRLHDGPTIITARYGEVAEMAKGKPTGEKLWSVRAEKDLAFDVDAVVLMPSRGTITLSKLRSARSPLLEPLDWPTFTMDAFWRRLGLADGPVGLSDYDAPATDAEPSEDSSGRNWLAEVKKLDDLEAVRKLGNEALAAKVNREVTAAIRARVAELTNAPESIPLAG